MASQTRIAGTGANDTSVGSVAWGSPEVITADDSSFALATAGNNLTNYLKATNFGFTIPSIATVDGIEVIIGDRASAEIGGLSGPVTDSAIRIVKGGVIGSANKSEGASWPIATTETVTFGSSTDLWGETWTPADINSSSFGVVISAQGGGTNAAPVVDYISITVHYSLPGILENISKAAFAAPFYPIDKIIWESPLQSRIVSSGNPVITTDDNFSVAHPKGRETIVEGIFSIDGDNFYPFGSLIHGSVDGGTGFPQTAKMTAYNDENNVYFRIKNGFTSNVNFRYYYWLESIA